MLRSLYHSPALRAAAAFGLGGVAFSVGNLVLARVLSSYEYGLVSLVIGVVSVSGPSAPLGMDFVISRRGLALGSELRRKVLLTSVLVGLGTAAVAAPLYRLGTSLMLVVLVATTAMGISQATAAHFQSQRQFGLSMPFIQASNWSVLLIGIVTWAGGVVTATLPCALIAISGLLTAAIGWIVVSRRAAKGVALPAGLWAAAIPLLAINVAGSVALQLERLIIPMTIGIRDLALFGVTASLVGSPYRMLQMAVLFTIIPRLRDASTVAERWRLLRHEFLLLGVVMGPASIAIWLLAPRIAHWFLAGRYDLGGALIVAVIISGLLKVLSAFGQSVVSALAPDKCLRLLSSASWGCIVLAIALAFAFRSWGLTGIIYATSVGWLVRTCVAFWISAPHLTEASGGRAHVSG
jgi:O-antigen/teichoic acid export membrane protein